MTPGVCPAPWQTGEEGPLYQTRLSAPQVPARLAPGSAQTAGDAGLSGWISTAGGPCRDPCRTVCSQGGTSSY